MNTKTKVMQRIPWWTALLVLAAMAVPVSPVAAEEVTDSIRAQGRSAIDAMRADIRPTLEGVKVGSDGAGELTVEQSIRFNGITAMHVMARELKKDAGLGLTPVSRPRPVSDDGLVSVSATAPVVTDSGTESL